MTQQPDPTDPVSGEDVARVITTAQEWLRTQVPHLAPVDEQGQTCPCPLCKVVATVRDVDPDLAATWLNTALASFSATLASYTRTQTDASNMYSDTRDSPGDCDPKPTTVDDQGRSA